MDLLNSFEERLVITHDNGNYSAWGGRTPYFFRIGNKVVLFNLPTLNMKFIAVIALFANPEDVEGCDWSTAYPIPADRLMKLEMLVKQDISSLMIRVPYDQMNDANPHGAQGANVPKQTRRRKDDKD
jgi:hypothetical protein